MKEIFITLYTKEHGRQDLTLNEWDSYDVGKITLHREDGPAVEYVDGNKPRYVNGKSHRFDGPAVVHTDGIKYWYFKGILHRKDGPAVEFPDEVRYWYVNGIKYTEEEHKELINHYKSLPKSIRLTHELWWVRDL